MMDWEDLPEKTEFDRTLKRKMKEACDAGKDSFDFVVREDGKCYDTENAPGLEITHKGPLRIIKFPT